MISNTALQNILATATDFSTVVELYSSDATPSTDGFDPNDALGCFAAVEGITFMGVEYDRKIKSVGSIKRTITKETNSASVTFSNINRQMAAFEFANGFEGLIMVTRLISRSESVSLATSMILFTGRCDRPDSGDKESLTVKAKFILGGLDPVIPRRKYTADDSTGRVVSDPEFEGFRFQPRYGSVSFTRVEKRGGFLGWWNKKIVRATIMFSNNSDLNGNTSVAVVFGRAQIQSVLVGGVDVGTALQTVNAFCDGDDNGIEDFINVRSTDPGFPLSATNYSEHLGLTGAANGDNPTYIAPGYYSRTGVVRVDVTNSAVDVNDAPPDIVGVVLGLKIKTPDPATGIWNVVQFSDNAAAQTRHLLTSPYYFNLDDNWIDDDYATACFDYNRELIFDMSLSDFLFVEEG